jgi:hypothetical protein
MATPSPYVGRVGSTDRTTKRGADLAAATPSPSVGRVG